MKLVDKKDMSDPRLVGPISEGETPEQAIARMQETFGMKDLSAYAFIVHAEPLRGKAGVNQQFDSIIGSVCAK
jgi:hypothetical protein